MIMSENKSRQIPYLLQIQVGRIRRGEGAAVEEEEQS